MKQIRFLQLYSKYNKGDVVSFSDSRADEYVKRRIAEYVEGTKQETKVQTKQKDKHNA